MNPPIPYTKANSLPVTLAEDQVPLPVTLSSTPELPLDVSIDAAQLPLPVNGDVGAFVSGSASSVADLFILDMDGYNSVYVQIIDAGTTCTVTYTTSNDGVNFINSAGILAYNNAYGATSTTAVGQSFPKKGRYFKAAVTTYGSGVVNAIAYLSKTYIPLLGVNTVTASSTSGVAAHDAAVSGNPVRIAARAVVNNYTAVSTGDTADLVTTTVGALIIKPYAIPGADWTYAAAASGIANTTTAVTIKAAAAAGIKNYVTSISFMSESLGAATELAIRDGAGGTVLWRTKIPITTVIPMTNVIFPSPLQGTAATLLEVVTLTASVTGAVYFNATGYIAP